MQTEKEEDDDDELDGESFDSIFESQSEYWKIPSEKELNSSRYAERSVCSMANLKELIKDVQVILNRVADKRERLIGNFTTKLAESWMAIRCEFDGGKVMNRCGKGSWNTRCYGGALRKNLGVAWSPLTFQTTTKTQAGVFFHQAAKRQTQLLNVRLAGEHLFGELLFTWLSLVVSMVMSFVLSFFPRGVLDEILNLIESVSEDFPTYSQKLIASQKYKAKPENKRNLQTRKLENLKQSTSKKARYHYGSNLDDSPDVSAERAV